MVGGTFHSVAHRFVRRHAAALGLPAGFGVLDAGDAADLLDLVRQEAGVGQTGRRFPRKSTLLDIYSRTVNAQRPLRELLAEAFPWCERHADDLARLFVDYGARKRGLGVIDLDDLLLYWRALAQDAVVGAQLSGAIDHVLVDEYQDVNGLQVDLVRGLRSERADVTVVGDDLQAVYGFRSASPEHILAFPEHFPGATVVTLERNYRATQPLLDVANAVAAQAERAYRKVLRAERPGGRAPELVLCLDEAAQATEVCERVLDARERGAALREQAVLMRASHDSDLLELELARRDIPYVKYGGLRYLEAAHVKDFLALLRLADNPADRLELVSLAAAARRGRAGHRRARARSARARRRRPARRARALARRARRCSRARRAGRRTPSSRRWAPPPPRRRPARAPRRCATRWRRSSRRTTPTAPCACSTSTRWWRPPASRRTSRASSPTWSSIRRPRARTWPGPAASTRTGSCSAPCTRRRAWSGARCTCSRSTTATSPPTCRRAIARRSRRSGACSTSRSPAPSATCTSTCPLRYYHRPRGVDDGHGYGKASRFLTEEVQSLCRRTDRTGLDVGLDGEVTAARAGPRIEVSVDALFR